FQEEQASGASMELGQQAQPPPPLFQSEHHLLADMRYLSEIRGNLSEIEANLPSACEILEGDGGSKLYLVGTAHFSEQSCQDVRDVIRQVKPHRVILELCQTRTGILTLDEDTLRAQVADTGLESVRRNARSLGWSGAIMHYLMGRLSACIMDQIGLLPGGEFRAAVDEARGLPFCEILLKDRSIRITIQRTLSKLSLYGKLRLAYCLLFSMEAITKEQIEMFKDKDLLEQLLAELGETFPELREVIVDERDRYMAYQFRSLCKPLFPGVPSINVAVVGFGHKTGIRSYWPAAADPSILGDCMTVPVAPLSERLFLRTAKYTLIGSTLFLLYLTGRLTYRRILLPLATGIRAMLL
uniref:TraB domain containing n=2 Tax=Macrostomum lignano TaxID=282301 RepID=A0A1I8IS74_9PLAT